MLFLRRLGDNATQQPYTFWQCKNANASLTRVPARFVFALYGESFRARACARSILPSKLTNRPPNRFLMTRTETPAVVCGRDARIRLFALAP